MKRQIIPRGWYAVARPDGHYAVLIRKTGIQTPHGLVPLPNGQNLLWLDLSPDGHNIAGIGNADDRAWRWDGAEWHDEGGVYGPRGLIFDLSGTLQIQKRPVPHGYRQYDDAGRLVLADATYADTARRIYEYTTHGGITIGQAGESGIYGDDPLIALLPDGSARLLRKGRCRAVRFYRDGDSLAVAWSQEDQIAAGLLWLTVQELNALPVYQRPVSIPAIGRPLWVGFFEFHGQRSPVQGNCALAVDENMLVRATDGTPIWAYAAGKSESDLVSLDVAVQQQRRHGLPVLAYWTRAAQEIGLGRPNADIFGVEAYRLKTETLRDFETRVRDAVARSPAAVLIAQCYTSNVDQVDDLASLVPVFARIAKGCSNVIGIIGFSGAGRLTGLQDHADVQPLWRSLFAGIPRAPEIEEIMPAPKITVTRFDGLIREGWECDWTDGDRTYSLTVKDKALVIAAKNALGGDHTGTRRQVLP